MMMTRYYKKGDNLLYLNGEDLEVPSNVIEITAEEYESLRKASRDNLAEKAQEYLSNLRAKKQQAREALIALGLDAELALEVIK